MSGSVRQQALTGESLLKVGRSWKILAFTVIVLLSLGLAVMVYGQLESHLGSGSPDNSRDLLRGFGFLMLLTVGYLVGQNLTATRNQRRLIDQLLEEEAIARARRLDPITQFHHPQVCRDILLRQANHAARLHAPVSLLELTLSNFGKSSLDSERRALAEEFLRQIKSVCRPIDALLRWTPDSFLLVFPEVTHTEFPAIRSRIHQELEQWCTQHMEADQPPELSTRGVTTETLTASGDILRQTQRLLEEQELSASVPSPPPSHSLKQQWRRTKSVGLTLEFHVRGTDQEGNPFQEAIVTERVATDRLWFVLRNNEVPEQSSLTIVSLDGAFEEVATVAALTERGDEHVVEAQFEKIPENWVLHHA